MNTFKTVKRITKGIPPITISEETVYQCPFCKKEFDNPIAFSNHINYIIELLNTKTICQNDLRNVNR